MTLLSSLRKRSIQEKFSQKVDALFQRDGSISTPKNTTFEIECESELIESVIKFVPGFNILENHEIFIERLDLNKCVVKFKVCNDIDIKGLIYVKTSCMLLPDEPFDNTKDSSKKKKKFNFIKTLNPLRLVKALKRQKSVFGNECDNICVKKVVKPYGEALIIWSVDGWQNWDTVEATYVQQTNDFLVYEATLKDVDGYVGVGQSIEFAACYQNDTGVFKDTNDDKCFIFERVDKEDSFVS
jgi:hypothetical protein